MNGELISFTIASLLAICGAIGVVALVNPIYSALSLLVTLLGVATIFANLGAHFLAIAQITVYAGAIMVLVLFVLMLLNVKYERRSVGQLLGTLGAIFVGAGFLYLVIPILHDSFYKLPAGDLGRIGFELAGSEGTVKNIGRLLFTKYLFTFEVASILLIVAIVGAVLVSRRVDQPEA
jgi:NADH-quinone oxidoreductase subunit J